MQIYGDTTSIQCEIIMESIENHFDLHRDLYDCHSTMHHPPHIWSDSSTIFQPITEQRIRLLGHHWLRFHHVVPHRGLFHLLHHSHHFDWRIPIQNISTHENEKIPFLTEEQSLHNGEETKRHQNADRPSVLLHLVLGPYL